MIFFSFHVFGFGSFGGPGEVDGGTQDLIRSPHREQERKRQQQAFDDCVTAAVRKFRRADLSAIAKIAAGTVGTTLAARGALSAGRANASGVNGVARAGARVTRYGTRYRVGQAIEVGGAVAAVFTGQAILDGFNQSSRNFAALDKDINLCKGLSPQADHSTMGIRLTTWF
jgi:hypothetical protein